MEITPSPFAQVMGVEQAAPETVAPAEGFSEALAGAGSPSGGPPGKGAPPGSEMSGEGVEIAEPNAPSRKPDFLPNLSAQDPIALLGGADDASGKTDQTTSNAGSPDIGAIAAAVAGALALQMLPQGAQPVVSLKVVQGGQTAEPPIASTVARVSPIVPETPVLSVATPPVVVDPSANTEAQAGPTQEVPPADSVELPPQAAVFESSAPVWQSTIHRALDDLAFLAKNQDVIQRRTGSDPVAEAQIAAAEPAAVTGDFFAVQDEVPPPPATAPGAVTDMPKNAASAATTPKTRPSSKVVTESPAKPAAGVAQAPQEEAVAEPISKADVRSTPSEAPVREQPAKTTAETVEPAKSAQPAQDSKPPKAAVSVDAQAQETVEPIEKAGRIAQSAAQSDGENGDSKNDSPKHADGAPIGVKAAANRVPDAAPFPAARAVESVERVGSKGAFARSEPLTGAETGDVIRQVVDRAEALAASRPRNGVVVHLEPRDLGSITLIVKSVGNQVDAQIGASNEHVRQALDQSRAQLGQALENRGLNLNSVNIDNQTASGNYAQTHQQATQHQQNGGGTSRPTPTRAADDPSTTPNLETIRKSVRKQGGVDIWT